MRTTLVRVGVFAALALGLAACGTDPLPRVAGGSLLGGAAGAGTCALLGGVMGGPLFPVTAAAGAATCGIAGAVGGGAVGAVTTPSQVNLGAVPGSH